MLPPSTTLGVAVRLTVVTSLSSLIVAVPTALAFEVEPAVRVAVRVKVSLPSAAKSSVVATRTCALVLPAAMVTPPTGTATHAVPLKYSSVVPVSVPTVAVPEASAGLKVTAVVEGFDSATVKTAKPPSPTVGELTDRAGRSLSLIVPRPLGSAMVALTAPDSSTLKFSAPS